MLPTSFRMPGARVLLHSWPALCFLISSTPAVMYAQQASLASLPDAPSLAMSRSLEQSTGADKSLGSISGTVRENRGASLAGANVTLSDADGASIRETTSNSEGRYEFRNVTPGMFTVTVTLDGFDSASSKGSLQPGQAYEISPFALSLATVYVEVEAVDPPLVSAEEQLHLEEKQRLIGIVPNFFVSYNWNAPPLTSKQKFRLALKNASDPGNLLLVGTVAGVQQATDAFSGYGQGAAGYGRRYGADLGNLVAGTMMGGAVLPSLFHQDPRYFYKGTGSTRSRVLYALSSAFICRGDNGRRQPAFASVLGDLSAGAISNLYYAPSDRQGAVLTIENGFLGIAGDAMNNMFQEFFLRKLTPKADKGPSATP